MHADKEQHINDVFAVSSARDSLCHFAGYNYATYIDPELFGGHRDTAGHMTETCCH